jgi:hypothetical protein
VWRRLFFLLRFIYTTLAPLFVTGECFVATVLYSCNAVFNAFPGCQAMIINDYSLSFAKLDDFYKFAKLIISGSGVVQFPGL